jgi:UDP-N-acetylmuramoyl-tripeptide--D-alanyl-D-alanine ligase
VKLTLGQVADWIHAEGVFDTSAEAVGYSIDSRTIGAGELFFAVKGERMDGHDYVDAAIANGAVAAVVSQRWLPPAGFDEKRVLRVPDDCDDCVLRAMQTLANRVRQAWGKRVIGVTGSAGKTTTKECIAQVLSTKFSVLKTEGNLNNHFGVPLTLLRLEPEHEVLVLEMGMNHAGEIAALAKITEPDWGVVSNVGMAHAEFFADGIEGIARAKRELVDALPENGVAFLNGDDARVRSFGDGLRVSTVLYGTSGDCDVRATNIEDLGLNGTDFDVQVLDTLAAHWGDEARRMVLRLPGRHNVLNALAAIAVGIKSDVGGVAALKSLAKMRPTEKRGNLLTWHGAEIVNDTYNSNPTALLSMIEALKKTKAKRLVLIAGEMLELGEDGARLHAECGEAAAEAALDIVIGVRGLASEIVKAATGRGVTAQFLESAEQAGVWMKENLREGDVVLLKASRGVRLERALDVLEGA